MSRFRIGIERKIISEELQMLLRIFISIFCFLFDSNSRINLLNATYERIEITDSLVPFLKTRSQIQVQLKTSKKADR